MRTGSHEDVPALPHPRQREAIGCTGCELLRRKTEASEFERIGHRRLESEIDPIPSRYEPDRLHPERYREVRVERHPLDGGPARNLDNQVWRIDGEWFRALPRPD